MVKVCERFSWNFLPFWQWRLILIIFWFVSFCKGAQGVLMSTKSWLCWAKVLGVFSKGVRVRNKLECNKKFRAMSSLIRCVFCMVCYCFWEVHVREKFGGLNSTFGKFFLKMENACPSQGSVLWINFRVDQGFLH